MKVLKKILLSISSVIIFSCTSNYYSTIAITEKKFLFWNKYRLQGVNVTQDELLNNQVELKNIYYNFITKGKIPVCEDYYKNADDCFIHLYYKKELKIFNKSVEAK